MHKRNVKIALIGAGSASFGPRTVTDILLSEPLMEHGVEIALMDKVEPQLARSEQRARAVSDRLGRKTDIRSTMNLHQAIEDADFVITAIEVNRYLYWAQDFHIPRKYGFRQIYGENGGPGGLFHALRNMTPMIEIALAMQRSCPDALLLNYTNPETKLCEAVTRLTSIKTIGLCHGVFMGRNQIARILEMPVENLDTTACGMNHFTWFQTIRDRETGADLYPKLREMEREGDWLSDWHEIGLSRILFRRFGLWPSPAANHIGEYLRWAEEFVASELQYFYDPVDGHPWQTGATPEFVYSLSGDKTSRPWRRAVEPPTPSDNGPLKASGELAIPIIESLTCDVAHHLAAINVPNRGAIPDLPGDMVVEIPAEGVGRELRPCRMEGLPEAIAAIIRLHGSIHKLIVEAFAERSKAKLLQALLLDPTVNSHRQAVGLVDEMLQLQADLLPKFH